MLEPSPRTTRWHTGLDLAEIAARIDAATHLWERPFALTWKLSGAGIVGRVLDLPATDRPLVGRVTPWGYELACAADPRHRHAFEPIAELSLQPIAGGTEVDLHVRLHREQRSFALPFALMGLACCVGAALSASAQPTTAALSATLGLAFLFLPPARSRSLFHAAATRCCSTLVDLLALREAPDRPAEG